MSKLSTISLKYYSDSINFYKIFEDFFNTKEISFIERGIFEDKKLYNYYIDYDGIDIYFNNDKEFIDFLYELVSSNNELPVSFSFYYKNISLRIQIMHTISKSAINTTILLEILQPLMIGSINLPDFSYYAIQLLPYFDLPNVQVCEFSYF